MQPELTEYCSRRRGLKNGRGRPAPKGRPREPVSLTVKLLILVIFLAPFAFAAATRSSVLSTPWVQANSLIETTSDPETPVIENFLVRYGVEAGRCARLAQALVASSRKHKLDARLLASILIVESRGDPHAISTAHAVGVMQIHVPTWGSLADDQGVNLFKVEDNIDMGAKILHDYIEESGPWEGVMRYHGFISTDPDSRQTAGAYADLVREIFES